MREKGNKQTNTEMVAMEKKGFKGGRLHSQTCQRLRQMRTRKKPLDLKIRKCLITLRPWLSGPEARLQE